MSITPNTSTSAQRKHRRWMAVLAVLALLAVFALYGQPGFMVMLADQVWACF